MATYVAAALNDPEKHFNTVIFTGDGTDDRAITVGFQPDLVWCRQRTDDSGGYLVDVVRGNNSALQTTNTNQAGTFASMTFTSTGITVSGNENLNNENAHNYVSWNWKAGGSAASNSSGDITSNVSVNTTAGISIVGYTGSSDASGTTVAHGLSAVPKMMIFKEHDDNGNNFIMYHHKVGAGNYLELNDETAAASSSIMFGNTTPTSSVFTIANDRQTNGTGSGFIAYCFAEKQGFSKMGEYEGNNNTDGTFIYTGFKPAMVLIKNKDANQPPIIFDNTRDPSNLTDSYLFPNIVDAEGTSSSTGIDFVSNGFKQINTYASANASNTYVYLAFAEAPLVNSNGVPCNAR